MVDAMYAEGLYQHFVEENEMERVAADNERLRLQQLGREHAARDDAARRERAQQITAEIRNVGCLRCLYDLSHLRFLSASKHLPLRTDHSLTQCPTK